MTEQEQNKHLIRLILSKLAIAVRDKDLAEDTTAAINVALMAADHLELHLMGRKHV